MSHTGATMHQPPPLTVLLYPCMLHRPSQSNCTISSGPRGHLGNRRHLPAACQWWMPLPAYGGGSGNTDSQPVLAMVAPRPVLTAGCTLGLKGLSLGSANPPHPLVASCITADTDTDDALSSETLCSSSSNSGGLAGAAGCCPARCSSPSSPPHTSSAGSSIDEPTSSETSTTATATPAPCGSPARSGGPCSHAAAQLTGWESVLPLPPP